MRRGLHNKVLAGLLALTVVVSGSGVYSVVNGLNAAAADDDDTELTKILGAEDLDGLRYELDDTSNVGEGHEVTLSDGSKITVKDNGTMRPELSSQDLADTKMGMGINLGNTLEAVRLVEYKSTVKDRTEYDTAWSNPVTTRAYIDLLHSYGINTLRIPVAWSNGDLDKGDYKIQGKLLDRVEEVVNYALDNGMYVIINDHWDNQWWGQFGACVKDENGDKVVDQETRDGAWERYKSYWTQISERFQGYSDHLIFEGANEELCERLNDGIVVSDVPSKGYCKPDNAGADVQTVSGNLTTAELYETTNLINQTFVDTVRSTGGNNASRHLLIPGYATNIQSTADERYKMPTDTEENGTSKLFLSVHYYTPTDFCLDNPNGIYTVADQKATKKYFEDLKKFSDAGYGIIIGECGVCEPSNVSSSVTQWFYDVFTEAKIYHAVPVLWDNGAYFDRTVPEINYKDIAIFLNTVNGANGSTDAERETGGAIFEGAGDIEVPAYLDSKLWSTPGMHAYLSYQTATWDYRDAYIPLKNLGKNKHSWDYIVASGAEVSILGTKVTDVQITGNGEYTVAIEGIDLSGSNYFNMLSVSTDIPRDPKDAAKDPYPGITATNATVKFDGVEVKDEPFDLVVKSDDKYYNFMLINKWGEALDYPLGEDNENEKLKIPSKSIEITFTINGLEKALADIESGEWVNQETGKKLNDTGEDEDTSATQSPTSPTPTPDTETNLEKGATFADGNYNYKVTKAAASKKGTVTLTGLEKKGKSAKKLSVANTVKGTDGATYTVSAIGKKAFSGAKATSITLNKSIKKIPSSAFAKCKKLNTLTLNAKLSSVAKNAFSGCKKKIKVKGKAKKDNLKKLKKTSYKKFK